MFDLKNGLKAVRVISPVAIGTTGTGQVGKIVDRKGYIGPVLFAVEYGTVTATTAVYTTIVKEGDVTGTMTSVADVDLIGTEAGAGVGATGTRVSGTSKNCVKTIGYKGGKRYCNITVKSTTTATTPIAATAFLDPASKPAA
ncbi:MULTISPECIES: hypothetical protein [Mesorhizobium]|uniref:hypothetical protein n=1 Tax=Mesorhizobium TaxID=68287 RepID=UPI0010A95B17|nr:MULTISPECIES: hypothetical protein [Mesorhizobium]